MRFVDDDDDDDGSRSGFLSCGVINAALNAVGTTPCCNERLNSSTRNDASSSIFSFSRRVGRGLDSHCLSGSRRTVATTSTTVSGRKLRNAQPCGVVENCPSVCHEMMLE